MGQQGPAGVSGYQIVTGPAEEIQAQHQQSLFVSCPGGKVVIGGGERNNGGYNSIVLTDSFPSDTASWGLYVNNTDTTVKTVTPFAICASA